MNHLTSKTLTFLFALFFGCLSIANAVIPDRIFSQNENRYLKQRPALDGKEVGSGAWMREYEEYVTDQFFARDGWVGLKNTSELMLQKRASNGVYFARGGYLIESFDELDRGQFEKNLGYLEEFSSNVREEFGVEVQVMLVPTASSIHADKLPRTAPELDQRALLAEAADRLPGFVPETYPLLYAHRGEYIYYRTDHHWTSLGAFYGYNAWRQHNGLAPAQTNDYHMDVLAEDFLGTTYSKASPYWTRADSIFSLTPRRAVETDVWYSDGEESSSIYAPAYLSTKDKYSVFLNANQPLTIVHTNNNNGRKLLLVKDSYANSFVQMLISDFEEIHIIDPRYFRTPITEYMAAESLTDVLVLYNLKGFAEDVNLFYLSASK